MNNSDLWSIVLPFVNREGASNVLERLKVDHGFSGFIVKNPNIHVCGNLESATYIVQNSEMSDEDKAAVLDAIYVAYTTILAYTQIPKR